MPQIKSRGKVTNSNIEKDIDNLRAGLKSLQTSLKVISEELSDRIKELEDARTRDAAGYDEDVDTAD